jgi:molecular chaperone DnaJ
VQQPPWIQIEPEWAILGCTRTIKTFDGPERVTVPPGTQNGDCLKGLADRGDRRKDGSRGELRIHAQVVIPSKGDLTAKQRSKLEDYAAERRKSVS